MNAPIGIFDSGLGGLTVLKELLRTLPNESFVYFGDTARVPYGTKSQETILRFSEENIRLLQSHAPDLKMVVIACHTASSLALDEMREKFSIPIIGVVDPGAKKSVSVTSNHSIGIIGTQSTIESKAYSKSILKINQKAKVHAKACPLFVPFIEEGGWIDSPIFENVAKHYLSDLLKTSIDTLVLGCTHYPILSNMLERILPASIQLVDPARETAIHAKEILKEEGLQNHSQIVQNAVRYYVSDAPEHFCKLSELFLGQKIAQVEKSNKIETPYYS